MSKTLIMASDIALLDHQGPLFAPISFALKQGEHLYLTGENGIGKSSLLKSISHDLFDFGVIEYAIPLIDIGWLPHQLSLYPRLNLNEQFAYFKAMSHEIPDYFFEAKKHLCCHNMLNTPFCNLSQGQKQRASLLVLLQFPMQLLLLDEPLSHQDVHHRNQIAYVLKMVVDTGVAILEATHQPDAENQIKLERAFQ